MTEVFSRPRAATGEVCLSAIERKVNLLRREAPAYLERHYGLIVAAATLARYASEGRGPRFFRLRSKTVLYAKTALDEWAREELGEEAGSTIEHNARERGGQP